MQVGDRIAGKYVLLQPIGQGGMGSVWVARNELVAANVALKVLLPAPLRDPATSDDATRRFRHEARVGSMLRHRSITRVFDLLEEQDGALVLVMELLRGQTLHDRIQSQGSLSVDEAIAIAVPILSALDHAHEMGIVHRDVKPSNIYLSVEPDGQIVPKLLDFGIAKGQKNELQTLEGRVLGTPGYMAPEQIRAVASEITGKSDLFSMGVVTYEMITGAPPFDAPAPSATLAAVLESEVDADPRIVPKVWLEVHRALSKRPNERHASARAMAQALAGAIDKTEPQLSLLLRTEEPPIETVHDNRTGEGVAGSVPAPPRTSLTRRTALGALLVACTAIVAFVTRARVLGRAAQRSAAREQAAQPPAPVSIVPASGAAIGVVSTPPVTRPALSVGPPTIANPAKIPASPAPAVSVAPSASPFAAASASAAPAPPPAAHAPTPTPVVTSNPHGIATNPGF